MIGRAAPLLLAAIAAATYGGVAVAIARTRSFWVDEALAVWAARLPTARDVVGAIWNGAEFSPPTYDLFLHVLSRFGGLDPLVARLPSILAVALAAALLGYMVGARLGPLFGALAFALALNAPLFDYAIQARAYALLAALTAGAAAIWNAGGRLDDRLRAAGVGSALFACVCLHFYAVVGYAAFALMELLWSLRRRRVRPAMWMAFAASALACAAWAPLVRRLSAFNGDDTASPGFYAAPTLAHLAEHVRALFVGDSAFWIFILAAALLLAGAAAAAHVVGRQEAPRPEDSETCGLAIVGVGLLAYLPVGFALAVGVTHAFSARYALAATMGAVVLVALGVAHSPFRRGVAYALLAILCVLPLARGGPGDLSAAAMRLLQAHPSTGPIVIGDGNFYMEMMEAADPEVRARLVYLLRPDGVVDGDTSAEHQLLRLKKSFRPDLAVRDFASFVSEHPAFVLFARPGKATDGLSPWLVQEGWATGVASLQPALALMQARVPSTAR